MCQRLFGSRNPAVRTQSPQQFPPIQHSPPCRHPAVAALVEHLRPQPGALQEPGSETGGCRDVVA